MRPNDYRAFIAARQRKVMEHCREENSSFEALLQGFDDAVEQQRQRRRGRPFQMRLRDVARICAGDKADFWLQRRGSEHRVGRPMREAALIQQGGDPTKPARIEEIGICVTRTDIIVPAYLFFVMEMLWLSGYWKRYSHGTLKLQNITTRDVLDARIGFTP